MVKLCVIFVGYLKNKNEINMDNWQEYIGYAASFMVVLSFTLNKIRSIRWVNLIGALLFTTYGLLIEGYPIVVTNVFLTLIQVYYLFIKKEKK